MLADPRRVTLRHSLEDDARYIGKHLRQADRIEVAALDPHHDPEEAPLRSMDLSALCWTALHKGRPVCIFGVSPKAPPPSPEGDVWTLGVPWMLGTDGMKGLGPELLRLSPGFIGRMHQLYPSLGNLVWTEHRESLRWLRWLGFKAADYSRGLGANGEDFVLMLREVDEVDEEGQDHVHGD